MGPGDQGNLGSVGTKFFSHSDGGTNRFDARSCELDAGSGFGCGRAFSVRSLKGANLIVETLDQSFGFGEFGAETVEETCEDLGWVGSSCELSLERLKLVESPFARLKSDRSRHLEDG